MNTTQQIINDLRERGLPEIGDPAAVVIGPIVRDAIAAAVRQEREACAEVARWYGINHSNHRIDNVCVASDEISSAIRARSASEATQ